VLALLYVPETLPAAQGRNVCACFCALCGGGSGGGSGKRGEGAYGKLATEDTDGEEGAESGSATRDNDAAAQKAAEKKPGPCALMSRRVPAVAILAYVLQVRMPAMLSILNERFTQTGSRQAFVLFTYTRSGLLRSLPSEL
jgi:hypothetical protein